MSGIEPGRASVIVSVYKDVAALRAVLDSLRRQTVRGFEVVVSEDGRDDAMRGFVGSYDFGGPWRHLTQDDAGWRKNRALNRAIVAARGEWLVFIDGDCVLHPRFVEFHLRLAGAGRVLAGKRVKLGPWATGRVLAGDEDTQGLQRRLALQALGLAPRRGNKFVEEGVFIDPDSLPMGIIPRLRTMRMLKGCNMSLGRRALEAVNGFDMDYTLPAVGEDVDLCWRLLAAGYELRSVRNMAVQYHLHHDASWSSQETNLSLLRHKMERGEYVCRNGLREV